MIKSNNYETISSENKRKWNEKKKKTNNNNRIKQRI